MCRATSLGAWVARDSAAEVQGPAAAEDADWAQGFPFGEGFNGADLAEAEVAPHGGGHRERSSKPSARRRTCGSVSETLSALCIL